MPAYQKQDYWIKESIRDKAFDDFYGESAWVYSMVTGWDTSSEDLERAGERINNLKKL